jgi:hypothetical protein
MAQFPHALPIRRQTARPQRRISIEQPRASALGKNDPGLLTRFDPPQETGSRFVDLA